jgi:D-inositol-3-phosphate glycosyltransferase
VLKIALYNLTTTTKYGGVESFVWDLARELAKREHQVTIIGGVGSRREHAPGVRVITFPFVSRYRFQALPPLRRAYAEAKLAERLSMALSALPELAYGGYDILHLQKPYDLGPALLARKLGGPKVILGCHGEDFYRGDRSLARMVDASVSCSNFNADTVARRYGVRPAVVFNGIDTTLFRPVQRKERTEAEELWRGVGGRLLFVGRLQPWKGVDVAIRALPSIPGAQLLIAGDGEDRQRLETLVHTMQLGERVHFAGALPRQELPALMRSADLLVATSWASETFGIGLVEAQACGLPVVASDFGGFPEVVDVERTGLLYPPKNHEALAVAVNSLLHDADRRRTMAAAAPAWAAQFAWPAVTDRIERVYRLIAASKSVLTSRQPGD